MRQLKIIKQITGRGTYSMDKYLQDISRIPVLTPQQEVDYATSAKGGDKEAKEKLILGNLRFVVSVAKQYQSCGMTLEDLINEGNLGLIKAVDTFDPTKGFKFISYAVWWIRQAILQAIAEHARLIRLPMNKISAISKIQRVYAKLEQELTREPSVREVAQEMGVSEGEIEESLFISNKPVSMDAPLTQDDEESGTLKEVFTSNDDDYLAGDPAMFMDSLRTELSRSLSLLTDKEYEILSMYYGLDTMVPMSLDEIGDKIGLTSERVRQLKTRALTKLKHIKNNSNLKTYL